MNSEFKKISKPLINKILLRIIESLDTKKLKDRNLKTKAKRQIDKITNELMKTLQVLTEYSIAIIENKEDDAIEIIRNNKYGGTFTRTQAKKIYKTLKQIIDIYKKSLKKYNKKKNISKLKNLKNDKKLLELNKKLMGGSNNLVDTHGNFTNEMNYILALTGGAGFDDSDVAGSGPSVLNSIGKGVVDVSMLVGEIFSGYLLQVPGWFSPYLDSTQTRKEKIDNAGEIPFHIPLIKTDLTIIQNILLAVKKFFTGASNDFPSEIGYNKLQPGASIIYLLLSGIMVVMMFAPLPILSYIINGPLLLNAILGGRRLLIAITIINIVSNILLGPLANIFIQGPLYFIYRLEGHKYLELYNEHIKGDDEKRQYRSKELLATYTVKSKGAVVVRESRKHEKKIKQLTKDISGASNQLASLQATLAEIPAPDDEGLDPHKEKRRRLRQEIAEKNTEIKRLNDDRTVSEAKQKLQKEESYTKMEQRHKEVIGAINSHSDYSDSKKAAEQEKHIQKIADIKKWEGVPTTDPSFERLYNKYVEYVALVKAAYNIIQQANPALYIGQDAPHKPRDLKRLSNLPKSKDLFKKDFLFNPELAKFKPTETNPFNFSKDIQNAIGRAIKKIKRNPERDIVLRNGGEDFETTYRELEGFQAVVNDISAGASALIEELRNPSEDFRRERQEHLEPMGDYYEAGGAMASRSMRGRGVFISSASEDRASLADGTRGGGESSGILDLYRTPI